MRALVTGGGGFLGLYVVEQLRARGDQVRVLCRGDYPRLAELGVETIRGDLADLDRVQLACQGCDVVFHTAALPGIWGPWKTYYETNTRGTHHVLAACRAAGVRRLVYTSTPSVVFDGKAHVDADESLPYARRFLCHYPHSKVLAEQAVLEAHGRHDLATVALRPHLIWGPRDNHLVPRLIERARAGRLRRVGPGDNLISMSYVENVAAAHLQAADRLSLAAPHGGRAYFINEPEPVRLWEWVDRLLAGAGLPPVRRSLSLRTAYALGALCEGVARVLPIGEPPMTRFLALQLGLSHAYRIAAAQRDFGYAPPVSTDEGHRRLFASLQTG